MSPPTSDPISSKTYTIAGLETTVYGLSELSPSASQVSCLWLLHPRLQVQSLMAPIAASHILHHNSLPTSKSHGLIAISFDQRNHGTRACTPLANESWKKGNPTHAQDMFSIFNGTAIDTSMLIDYLSSYIFPDPKTPHHITQHLVLGISLGGHAAWHCILHDPRITAAVIIIGCPDYQALMTDRARRSKLDSYTSSSGKAFLPSTHFPQGLVDVTKKWDPAALLMASSSQLWDQQRQSRQQLIKERLGGKHILCLSGGKDKLVPYACSLPFLDFLKSGLDQQSGCFNHQNTTLEDIVDDEAGHEYTDKMKKEAIRFISDILVGEGKPSTGAKTSKI